MSEYLCDSCQILCKCTIPDECDFVPKVCLAQLSEKYYEPNWHKEDLPADTMRLKIIQYGINLVEGKDE